MQRPGNTDQGVMWSNLTRLGKCIHTQSLGPIDAVRQACASQMQVHACEGRALRTMLAWASVQR